MEKLRLYIEKWIDGKKVKNINVTLYDINECIYIYNSILERTLMERLSNIQTGNWNNIKL